MKDEITDDDLKRILASTKDSLEKSIVCLMAYNGLRRSEVCNIRQCDIYELQNMMVIEIHGKGDKTRVIPLQEKCLEAIGPFLKSDRENNTGPLLTFRKKKLKADFLYKVIRKLVESANIHKNIHPHMFRAKFASLALESGVPITLVQADLGHASIETTAMYDHSKNRLDRSSVNKIRTVG